MFFIAENQKVIKTVELRECIYTVQVKAMGLVLAQYCCFPLLQIFVCKCYWCVAHTHITISTHACKIISADCRLGAAKYTNCTVHHYNCAIAVRM